MVSKRTTLSLSMGYFVGLSYFLVNLIGSPINYKVSPEGFFDVNKDGKEDVLVTSGLNSIDNTHHVEYIDGNMIEYTDSGYVAHANPISIPGTKYNPKTDYPRSIQIGQFDGKEGLDIKISEASPDRGVSIEQLLPNRL